MSTHLLHGHARFRDGYVKKTRSFLDKLASEGQNPDALFIGCNRRHGNDHDQGKHDHGNSAGYQ
jgi:hypothetical protein